MHAAQGTQYCPLQMPCSTMYERPTADRSRKAWSGHTDCVAAPLHRQWHTSHLMRMCSMTHHYTLFQILVSSLLVYQVHFRLYSLLARCSRTKTPFDLPVSFSADFNTRLSVRQYRCESWVKLMLN